MKTADYAETCNNFEEKEWLTRIPHLAYADDAEFTKTYHALRRQVARSYIQLRSSIHWFSNMIEGTRLRLRSFELTDVDEILKHWNKMEIRNLVGIADIGPLSRHDEEEWIRNTWKQRQEKKAFIFAIETKTDNNLIGGTSLFNINWTNRSTEAGIAIFNSENWGKGYGQEAMNLTLSFAFRNLNLNRVELDTFAFNTRAQQCYLKIGFTEVGRRRKARFIDGEYHDDIIMDILKDEWLSEYKESHAD